MRVHSITLRLTLLFLTVSTAVLLALGYLTITLIDAHFAEQDREHIHGKLALVRHALARARESADLDIIASHLADALVGHHDLSVAVLGPDSRVLYTSTDDFYPASLRADASNTVERQPLKLKIWDKNDQFYRGIAAPASTAIPGSPPATVVVAVNIGHHRDFMKAFRRQLWLAIASGIVLTALLGWVAARRGLAPVRAMTRVIRDISASRLGERLRVETLPPELVELANGFNDMLLRLEDSFRRLSDFSSDLAHELRTPISNLMTQTQVAVSRARTADEYREVLYSNLEELERLSRMIADMLFLAKADNGLIVPGHETVDLRTEIEALSGFYEAFSEDKGVTLRLDGTGNIQGDRLMIRRVLSNLLSNAIRHTPRGGTVELALSRDESGNTCLTVANPGETIPPEHLPRLFDRFYRVDASRHEGGDGAGLGLAITKSIIEAHHGTIQASSNNGTTRFTCLFPAV